MLCPYDFAQLLPRVRNRKDRRVMACVVLNAIYDPDQYPVDLSEVMNLQGENRVLTRAFLAWCALCPDAYASWNEQACERLFAYAQPKSGKH